MDAFQLSHEENAVLVKCRNRSIAVGMLGVLCMFSSWVTWLGFLAAFFAAGSGYVLRDRSQNAQALVNGHNSLCCCCSTPWSQLDAAVNLSIAAGVIAVVTSFIDIIVVGWYVAPSSLNGVVVIINLICCLFLAVASGYAASIQRRLIRNVFVRVTSDVQAGGPAPIVALGAAMGSTGFAVAQPQGQAAKAV